jgi:AcrR family transcriptional regulator
VSAARLNVAASVVPARETSKKKSGQRRRDEPGDPTVRRRILNAAFAVFMERGFSGASMLEIATRAKVSKRELYSLVGGKQDMLIACIAGRSAKMRWAPAEPPVAHDRESLGRLLAAFGARLLAEVSHPTVVATFRLAIAEARQAPQVARALEAQGRQANRAPLNEILGAAAAAGILRGDPAEMAEQFIALLWGDLFMALLLRLAVRPGPAELRRRARQAAARLLQLYGPDQK